MSSLLRLYDAMLSPWIGKKVEYVFAMLESSRQIVPNMSWVGFGRTRANVSQTTLAIDSGATIHFFSNKELLRSIKTIKKMKIHCGGTTFDQCKAGKIRKELEHLPLPRKQICIATNGIANLISMGKLVKEGYRVTMDSDVENAINVYNEDGSYIKFICVQDGLYCIDLDGGGGYTNFLTTVSEQKEHFSDVDNKKADLARYVQKCLCLPSDNDMADAIEKGGVQECGVDRRHIKIANIIYGPARAAIEGKSVQRKNKMPRESSMLLNIPPSILDRYGSVSLGIDVLHINKRPYVIAVSKHIKYIQCLGTVNKNVETFLSSIKRFKSDYMIRGL